MEKYPPEPKETSLRLLDKAVWNFRHNVTPSFQCPICNFESESIRNIYNHRKKHNPYRCTDCNFKTINKKQFDVHIKFHNGVNPFSCHKCEFIAGNSRDLIRHRKNHHVTKSHSCSLCNATFDRKPKLEKHVREHVREKPFACQYCHLMFSLKSSVVRHQDANRCPKNFKSFDQSTSTVVMIPNAPIDKVRKNVCDTNKNLINITKVANTQTTVCETEIRNDVTKLTKSNKIPVLLSKDVLITLAAPQIKTQAMNSTVPIKKREIQKRFTCNLCLRTFSKKYVLEGHIRVHTKERPYSCTVCSFTTAWEIYLRQHFQRKHPSLVDDNKKPEDTKSQKSPRTPSFSTSSQKIARKKNSVKSSKNTDNTKQSKFVCKFCDENVSTAFELLDHLRQHTGQTLYKCDHYRCRFKTLDKHHLDRHSFIHGNRHHMVGEEAK